MDGSFRGGGTGTGASNGGVGSNSGNRAREALAATVAAASRVWRALPLAQRTRGPELWTEKLEIGSNLWQNAKREVVLNIEFMSNRTTRVVLYQFRISVMVALALLIWETKIKFDDNSSNDMQESQPFITLNVVIASVCLTVMLGMAARLLLCIWRVNQAGKIWTPRRKRTVLLIGLEVAVQTVNLVFYLAPNAFVLAKPCSWFLTPIFIFSAVRWSCWNTMFCLFVIQAHNPMPARFGHSFALFRAAAARLMRRKQSVQQSLASQTGSDVTERARSSTRTLPTSPSCAAELEAGKLPQQLPAGGASQDAGLPAAAAQGGAADPATVQSEAEGNAKDKPASKRRTAKRMVVDLPIRTHAYKAMLLWVPCQVVIVVFLVHELKHGFNNQGPCTSLEDLRCFPQAVNGTADCINWDYNCKVDVITVVLSSLTSALLIITLAVYFAMLFFAQRQLSKKPYFAYRVGNILLHVQLQTRLVAAFFFALSNLLFWWIGKHSCTSYIETWMGLTPMEIVMTTLVVTNCICILPGDPEQSALELHAWLQDFAWLEADLPRKIAQRPQVPASEPMFCVETALKMLCWSWVVYCDEKSQGLAEDEEGSQGGEALDLVTALSSERHSDNTAAAAAAAAAAASGGLAGAGVLAGGAAAGVPAGGAAAAVGGGQQASNHSNGGGACRGGHGERGEAADRSKPSSANGTHGRRQQQQHPEEEEEGEEGDEELCLATALALYKLTEYAVLWGPALDAKCVIGWGNDSDTIVCCFRGTVSLKNMWKNVQVWRATHPPARGSYLLGRQPMVHAGFLDTWHVNALNTQVLDTLRQLLSRDPPSGCRPWQLLFTGHSMGGALASLAAYDATTLCAELAAERGLAGGAAQLANITMYSFGAPRPGNHAFARDYIAKVPASFAVVHCNDTVARNGKFLVLYKHAAHRIVLSPTGDLIVRPSLIEQSARESFGTSLQEHLLTAYGRSFAAIIRGQFQGGKEHNQGRAGCRVLLQCKYVQLVLRATAGVHQESIIRLGRVTGHPPPGVDQHLASGERLAPARQHTTLTSRRFARMSRRFSIPPSAAPLARMPTRHSLQPVRAGMRWQQRVEEEPNGDEAV